MRQLKFANMDRKRLARLFHRLQDFDYELKFIPGSENYFDFLSRAFAKEDMVAESHSLELNSNVYWAVEQGKCNDNANFVHHLVRDYQERSWLTWRRTSGQMSSDGSPSVVTCSFHQAGF